MKILLVSPSIFMSTEFPEMIFAPRDLAINTVNGLVKRGHEVVFATAPNVKSTGQLISGDKNLLETYIDTQHKKSLDF